GDGGQGLDHDEGRYHVGLVGHRYVRPSEAGGIPVGQGAGQADLGRAAGTVEDLHPGTGHGHVDAQPDRLGKGFLGREAGRQVTDAPARVARLAAAVYELFVRTQDAADETVPVARIDTLDALDPQQVGADAGDGSSGHEGLRNSDKGGAPGRQSGRAQVTAG